jgi:hypothetical protein
MKLHGARCGERGGLPAGGGGEGDDDSGGDGDDEEEHDEVANGWTPPLRLLLTAPRVPDLPLPSVSQR